MPDFNTYAALTAPAVNDTLLALDVSDTSASPAGTVKQLTVGTLNGQALPGTAPQRPLFMAPVKWALFNYDYGPTDAINATYAPGTIFFNQSSGVASNGGGSQVGSWSHTVSANVKTGELMLVVASVGSSAAKTLTISAASGHTWTAVGSVNTQTASGFTISTQVWSRTATSGDAGDVLTLGVSAGTAFSVGASGSWAGASAVDASAQSAPAGLLSSAPMPSVTTVSDGSNVVYVIGTEVSSGTPAVTGAFYGALENGLPTANFSGNIAMFADSGAVYPAGTAAGAGVSITGLTGAQLTLMSIALRPSGSVTPATLTSNVNGVLAIDGGSPAVNDRVVVTDPYAHGTGEPSYSDGIYTVTSVGSVSTPWVLTRAADMQSNAQLGQYWAVQVTGGAVFAGGQARVLALSPFNDPPPFAMGWSFLGLGLSTPSSSATAPWSTAAANSSSATGTQSSTTADASDSVAAADTVLVEAPHAHGYGGYGRVRGFGSSNGPGRFSFTGVNATMSAATGPYTLAYTPGQVADTGALVPGTAAGSGSAQHSVTAFAGKTTNATPTAIAPQNGTFTLQDLNGSAYWKRTMAVRGRVVARRTDTPGTDSAWSFQGVLRGNGSSAYSWVGGSAPSMTLIAQDSGASAWAAAWTISSNTLVLTVTGTAAETIVWEATLELDEVAG